ncbi:MAG: PD40 domain-containing protein [Caldisericaceae bacterium]|nr:PD40 domain-containing protein [Caldisericaceae bacterium]
MMRKLYFVWLSVVFLFLNMLWGASPSPPIMHYPDIHDDWVVFVAGGDIWKADINNGQAIRLTMHDGEEIFPKFSPDGSLIAFTGEYDGNTDVYVMNADGSNIHRVTYHPGGDIVVGWHPQNGKIIFRSNRVSYQRFSRLFMINPDGSGLDTLIMHEATQGSFSPDGSKIAYNRMGREFRTWKRYFGGTAQDIYIFDFKQMKDQKITDFQGTDRLPMWIGNKIYFSSDRDGVLNIYAYDVQSKQITQLTHHKNYDVRFPSEGGQRIVYELGGDLYFVDVNNPQPSKINIQIHTDAPELRPYLKKVDENVTQIEISPNGKRALLVARGEIFTVPAKEGPTRNLSNSSGSREKDAVWSPDGKWIAYFSDADGEYQLYLIDPFAEKKPQKLTQFKDGYRHTIRWSPDSKKLAFSDQTLTLYIFDLAKKKLIKVDKAKFENVDVSLDLKPIYDFNWSPDSRFIAYSKMDSTLVNKIYIYSLEEGKSRCVSEGLFNDFHPVFSKDGEHLFFISNRRFDPTYCDFEWEMVYKKTAGIYAYTLRKDGPPLFPLKSDEHLSKEKKSEKEKEENKKVRIDFDGLLQRIEALPVERGNYRYLAINDNSLFYLNKDEGDFNRFEFRNHWPMDLYAFDFDKKQERLVIKKVDGYKLSADGSTIVFKQGKKVGLVEASAKEAKGDFLNLSDLKMWYEPLAEWQQIYREAWRMERDFYYEPGMNGLEWPAIYQKYLPMVKRSVCRQDIRFVIGELIGELGTSHTYVFGGDIQRKAKRVNVGLLGADYQIDHKHNLYRFKKIYRVADWSRKIVPPLAGPGKQVKEGDYLLKVNNQLVTADKNIYSYFVDTANEQVTLLVNDQPTLKGARKVVVKPVGSEYFLRYLDWVEHNRLLVEKLSNGQIGYLHLPDTYNGSARIFPKYYYSQTRKKALIVDGRYNGGGLDPDIFLQRLNKKPLSFWTRRYSHDYFTPWMGNNAHLACLTNRQAGSGGDELPFLFRKKGMGPVIGTRSWGGLVGVSMWIPLVDGGGMSAPDYRIYDTNGKWVVENEGVAPDPGFEVDNDPVEMRKGYDAQLMKAVEYLLEQIKKDPRPWPKHEPFPRQKLN